MNIPEDWKRINLPLGMTVAVGSLFYGIWIGLHSEFVAAQEYQQYKKTTETRGLERDKKMVENEVMRLELKQQFYPKTFDPIDKALLKKQQKDLVGITKDLKEVQEQK